MVDAISNPGGARHSRGAAWLLAGIPLLTWVPAQAATSVAPRDDAGSSRQEATSGSPVTPWRFAAHAGWWDIGVDVTMPPGLLVGLGVPWAPFLFDFSGQEGLATLDARLGYRYDFLPNTSVFGGLLTAWAYDWGDPCGDGCTVHTHRLFFFPALGIRHRWPLKHGPRAPRSGPIIGLDWTLLVVQVVHQTDDESDGPWHAKRMQPWVGSAFTQAYVGYEW